MLGWRLHRRKYIAALLVLTAVSLSSLFVLGIRSLGDFEEAYAGVLRESADSTASQLAQQIRRDLKWPVVNLLEKVDHPAVTRYDVPNVTATLQSALSQFPTISTVFMWGSGLTPDGRVAVERTPVLFFVADPSRAALQAEEPQGEWAIFAKVLKDEAERNEPQRRNYALSYVTWRGRQYHVLFHFIYDQSIRNVLQGFIGFFSDVGHLQRSYLEPLLEDWHRSTGGSHFPRPAAAIVDDAGHEIVVVGRSLRDSYDAEATFPFLFFDQDSFETLGPLRPPIRFWTVRAGYEAGDIGAIVRRETAAQRWSWLLVAIVAVVSMALATWAMVKDWRVSQMKSAFVASISHDLKTPLAKIQLFADSLEASRVRSPEKAAAYYRVISAQSRKLSHLIGQLLDFSKLEAGVRHYPFEEIDLRAVVRSSLDMFEYELVRDEFTVEVSIPEGEVPVLGHAEGLQQLFTNLIGNAMKYSNGDRYLGLGMTAVGRRVRVEVTDHGIGIPVHEQPHVFDKFYRAANAGGTAGGSGIGLAIARDVVRAHHGTISLLSIPARGSTFTVELPMSMDSEGGGETDSSDRRRCGTAGGPEG